MLLLVINNDEHDVDDDDYDDHDDDGNIDDVTIFDSINSSASHRLLKFDPPPHQILRKKS